MKIKHLFSAVLIVSMGFFGFSCNQQKEPGKEKSSDDPRMAGFKGKIAKKFEDSKEDWPERKKAPAGTPNVMIILLDDVGFAQLGCNGGLIATPNIDKLAANGLNYTNFHTTANQKGNRILHINHRGRRLKQQAYERLKTEKGIYYRKRSPADVEPVFGNIKSNKSFKRFLLKGIEKTEIEWGLLCIAHNLKKIAA